MYSAQDFDNSLFSLILVVFILFKAALLIHQNLEHNLPYPIFRGTEREGLVAFPFCTLSSSLPINERSVFIFNSQNKSSTRKFPSHKNYRSVSCYPTR